MKSMKIVTRSEGMRIAKANPKSTVMKYCTGKYKWKGSQQDYVGKVEEVFDDVLALWVERRSDRDGPYALLMCCSER